MSATPALLLRVPSATAVALASGSRPAVASWLGRVDAVVLGSDGPGDADPSVAAAALVAAHPGAAWVLEGGVDRDFPYNLARRVASVAALSGARAGLLLADGGTVLPTARPASAEETTADAARLLRGLWESWPLDAVVADRRTRRFVDAERIASVGHDAVFRVSGPLQLPVDADALPPILQRVVPGREGALAGAEALVADASSLDAARSAAGGRPVLLETDADGLAAGWAGAGSAEGTAGILLADDPDRAAEALAALAPEASPRGGTLRARLGLSRPAPLLDPRRPAFTSGERW